MPGFPTHIVGIPTKRGKARRYTFFSPNAEARVGAAILNVGRGAVRAARTQAEACATRPEKRAQPAAAGPHNGKKLRMEADEFASGTFCGAGCQGARG
jgi:hypothetical protein